MMREVESVHHLNPVEKWVHDNVFALNYTTNNNGTLFFSLGMLLCVLFNGLTPFVLACYYLKKE